jgi:hypothetical protein
MPERRMAVSARAPLPAIGNNGRGDDRIRLVI